MKIAVVGTRGFPNVQGGVEVHCQNLYPALVRLGCEVIVFTRRGYVDESIKEYKGVKLITLSAVRNKYLEAFLHTLAGVIYSLKFRPDILHFQAIGPSFFASLARLLGNKVVLTSHGSNYKHLKWGMIAKTFLKFSEFAGITFSNGVIAVSETIAEEIGKLYKRKAVVIPNGVIMPTVTRSGVALGKYGLDKGRYVLAVGRLVPEKGFGDLIAAFRKIKTDSSPCASSRSSGWKLVIVGRADHEDEYSKLLRREAEANEDIVLTGFLDGELLQELYSNAGLFVLPSYYEGFNIALLEAMSYGLSCIVSDIAANKELKLAEDRYFKAGDIRSLAEKIMAFIAKPLGEEEMDRQRNAVCGKYNWDSIARKTLQVYESAFRT